MTLYLFLFVFSVVATAAFGFVSYVNERSWYISMGVLAIITTLPGVNAVVALVLLNLI